jgi:Xaa-Pro aminopeptidase
MDVYQDRRKRAVRLLARQGLEHLLVTTVSNVTYLTGFTGEDSFLLLGAREEVVITDMRYTTQLSEECPELRLAVRRPGVSMTEIVAKTLASAGVRKVGIEAEAMPVAMYFELQEKLSKAELRPTAGIIERLREIKDREEVAEIRRAVWYAEKAFAAVRATLRPEQTERQVAADLEHQIRQFGGTGFSFPAIVAAGPRSALPHGRASDGRIGDWDFVLVDWGATGRLYKSDLTRVLVTGRISPKLERIYGLVLKAQGQAIAKIRPGATCQEVDEAARGVISEAGHGRHFGHGLGHGLGLDIHESPRLGKNVRRRLKAGMVVTVEPGIYLPGWGGVRIEDDVLVTRSGHEVLSTVPKGLDETIIT